MSIFKNIKSIFIVSDPASPETQSAEPPAPAQTQISTQSDTRTPPPVSNPPVKAQAEERFLNILYEAMEKQGKAGFDYLEFKQSLTSLAKLAMDEKTRYQSAFAVAQTMGATPASLIEAADYYLQILSNEEKAFEQTLKSQMQKQIGDKENETKSIQSAIEEKSVQIEKLAKEIEDHKAQLNSMQQQIAEAASKIETTKQNFQASYYQIAGQIKDDMTKMQQYLK